MSATREPIYIALWNLIANAAGVLAEFVTTGRYLIPITDLPAEKMPALFLLQHGESWVKMGKGIPAKRTLQCSLVMYAYTAAQSMSYPATLINTMMDVLDDLLEHPGNPGNVQTLGGLVEHVYLEGEATIIEGQLGSGENASVMVAPIKILIP